MPLTFSPTIMLALLIRMIGTPYKAVSKPMIEAFARFKKIRASRFASAVRFARVAGQRLASEYGAFTIPISKKEDVAALSRENVLVALNERSEVLHNIFEEAGADLDPAKVKTVDVKDGVELAQQVNARNEELNWLGERKQQFDGMDAIKAENDRRRKAPAGADPKNWAPGGNGNGDGDRVAERHQSLGEAFVNSPAYEGAKARQQNILPEVLDVHASQFLPRPINATFLTTAGWAPESVRTPRLVLDEQRGIEVTDALPVFPTSMAAIVYMEETTFTNAAAERAENASYAESALALTQRTVPVRSIGTSLPVTDEQLDDVDGIRAYLDGRLGFMVRQRLDSQIIVGGGTGSDLTGTLAVSGINTQAKGADSVPDAVYKGIVAVQVTGRAQPNVYITHPTDWQDVRLLKTADGIYIWGSPADAGPERIWGLPVIVTTAITQNTGVVGDYARFAGLYVRKGLEVLTGYVNNDFLQGRVTIRAGLRVAVVHFRPSAFTQITGI